MFVRNRVWLGVLVVAGFISVVACSGKDEPAGPAFPAPSPVPTIAGDPLDYPMAPHESQTHLYAIDVPEGWRPGGMPGNLSEETFDYYEGDRLVSQMSVTCEPIPIKDGAPWTVDDFIERDLFYARRFGGELSERAPVTVGVLRGAAVTYATNLGAVPILQRSVYLPADCMWILRLRVFGTGDPTPYFILFDRMVASFRLLQPAGYLPLSATGVS